MEDDQKGDDHVVVRAFGPRRLSLAIAGYKACREASTDFSICTEGTAPQPVQGKAAASFALTLMLCSGVAERGVSPLRQGEFQQQLLSELLG